MLGGEYRSVSRESFREVVTSTARGAATSRSAPSCISSCVSTQDELLDALVALGTPPEGEILLCQSTLFDPLVLTNEIDINTDPESDFFDVTIGMPDVTNGNSEYIMMPLIKIHLTNGFILYNVLHS